MKAWGPSKYEISTEGTGRFGTAVRRPGSSGARRFERALGVSAKFYLRILRVEEAVRRMRAAGFRGLSDIAYDLGYSDQSHSSMAFGP
jgi:hypothetical protein